MLEILDPLNIDHHAYNKDLLRNIKEYSLLSSKRIGWNYCLDYTWLALQCKPLLKPNLRIVDIGAGPGAIHGYLEDMHKVDIIGVDRRRWDRDYIDFVGDFTDPDFRNKCGLEENSLDLIISVSAFEHNTVDSHKELVKTCIDCLKPGGRLITTFAITSGNNSKPFLDQWNLSRNDAEKIYGEEFSSFDYRSVWWRWRKHREMPLNFKQRYGKWNIWHPSFLAAGANIQK